MATQTEQNAMEGLNAEFDEFNASTWLEVSLPMDAHWQVSTRGGHPALILFYHTSGERQTIADTLREAVAPGLADALAFSRSVLVSQGLFELSERLAVEKADVALAAAGLEVGEPPARSASEAVGNAADQIEAWAEATLRSIQTFTGLDAELEPLRNQYDNYMTLVFQLRGVLPASEAEVSHE